MNTLWKESRLSQELLDGGKIIEHFFPGKDRGFVVIERQRPVKDEKDGREFWFALYEKAAYVGDHEFYEAVQYVKLRRKEVIRRAYTAYFETKPASLRGGK